MSFRPPSTSKETQRRVTPQGRRTPKFLNATASSTLRSNTATSSARQLEITTITNCTSATCSSQTVVNWEQECDDAYNDYLQALFKQQILKMNIAKRKKELSKQLTSQSKPLFRDKIELQRLEMKAEIEKENNEIPEGVQLLKEELDGFEKMCEEFKIENLLDRLNEMFSEAKGRVTLENVLPFNSQEQYDILASRLISTTVHVEMILKQSENLAKLGQLTQELKSVLCLKEEVINKEMQMEQYDIKLGFLILKKLSDYFARIRE